MIRIVENHCLIFEVGDFYISFVIHLRFWVKYNYYKWTGLTNSGILETIEFRSFGPISWTRRTS